MMVEAGRGSLWLDKGTGHRKVFRVTINKNQQYVPAICAAGAQREAVLVPGRVLAQADRMENGEVRTGRKDRCQKEVIPIGVYGEGGMETLFFMK